MAPSEISLPGYTKIFIVVFSPLIILVNYFHLDSKEQTVAWQPFVRNLEV